MNVLARSLVAASLLGLLTAASLSGQAARGNIVEIGRAHV